MDQNQKQSTDIIHQYYTGPAKDTGQIGDRLGHITTARVRGQDVRSLDGQMSRVAVFSHFFLKRISKPSGMQGRIRRKEEEEEERKAQ